MSDLPKTFWDGLTSATKEMVSGIQEGERSSIYLPMGDFVESPIEAIFATTVLCYWRLMAEDIVLHKGKIVRAWQTHRTADLIAQAPITGYRADFLLQSAAFPKQVRFVVECDGHDFHERTKEQAARDRSRDRAMTAMGYTVLRYTGSEIHRDPWACAADLYGHYDGRFCDAHQAAFQAGTIE